MLKLIGLGLWNEKDLSLLGLEEAKQCDVIYLEEYTSKLFGSSKAKLEKLIGKKMQVIPRKSVENGEILNYAISNDVALLIGGDPMCATTHSDLILQAKEKNIKTKIIHSSSIYSAIGETGLQIYKFGRSGSIVFQQENFKPTSFFEVYKENKKMGLHTLYFLDIDFDNKKYMTVNEALEILIKIGLDENTKIVGCARIGSEDSVIKYGTAKELLKFDFGEPMHVLIIPEKLHDSEREFLETL